MSSLYLSLLQLLRSGESVAVVTVVGTHGSTPREVGAKMVVRTSGTILGTIGGGLGEVQVCRTALSVIETGLPALELVDLSEESGSHAAVAVTDDEARGPDSGESRDQRVWPNPKATSTDHAGICGGAMEVLVERWRPAGAAAVGDDLLLVETIHERYARREPVVLATVVASPRPSWRTGQHVLLGRKGVVLGGLGFQALDETLLAAAIGTLENEVPRALTLHLPPDDLAGEHVETLRLHLEVIKPPPRLVILGAGHIAIPLSRLAKLLEFEVTVLDDRPAFATADRFPESDVVLVAEFREGIRRLAVDRDTYVVVITHGHEHDAECLREVVETDCAYLGMIGSRRKVRAVFELLGRQGVAAEKLARVHAPIGIDIGAQTPAEIAVAIAAEIVKVRRGGRAASMSEGEKQIG